MDYLQYEEWFSSASSNALTVLNLIINGLPSIHISVFQERNILSRNVLNLIINGLPSIRQLLLRLWLAHPAQVLNLIINGLPSIPTCEFHSLVFSLLLWF